mgnify:CR=1 FL=1
MSIDRQWDLYLQERGITPQAEVVPDHACQVFDAGESELDVAREMVHNLLAEQRE